MWGSSSNQSKDLGTPIANLVFFNLLSARAVVIIWRRLCYYVIRRCYTSINLDLHAGCGCRSAACNVPPSAALVMVIDMSHNRALVATSCKILNLVHLSCEVEHIAPHRRLLRSHGDRKLVGFTIGFNLLTLLLLLLLWVDRKRWLINLPPLRESSICDVLRCVVICMEMSVWASQHIVIANHSYIAIADHSYITIADRSYITIANRSLSVYLTVSWLSWYLSRP